MDVDVSKLKKMTLREIQTAQFDMLKDFARFCDENNIRYYLEGGTLLGAIRHKGFIPWDDDVDVMMPRPDYDKFESLCAVNFGPKYRISSLNNNKYHRHPAIRIYNDETVIPPKTIRNKYAIRNIWLDILPLDGLPDGQKKQVKFMRRQFRLKKIAALASKKFSKSKNIFKTIIKIILISLCRVVGPHRMAEILDNRAKRYKFEESEWVAFVNSRYGEKWRVRRAAFAEQTEVEFEGEMFKAPKGCHEYLTNLYGDYMQIPPVEKRQTHNVEAYWKNESKEN